MPKNKKSFKFNYIRLLPVLIFIGTLTLSIKINNVFDSLKFQTSKFISISQSKAYAEEKINKTTAELDQVLEQSNQTPSDLGIPSSPSTSFTQSEIAILQELAERREYLDLRSKEIDRKAIQLKVAEEELDKKLKQLQNYEIQLKNLIKDYTAKEKEKINSLVKLYSSMKPKDAARIFDNLDTEIIVSLLTEMKPSSSSAILSQMNPQKAKEVTDELIGNNFIKTDENKS